MKKMILLITSSLFLVGCATWCPSSPLAKRQAVMCTGCQSVWVASNAPAGKPGMFTMGPTHQHRACPYCSEMARKYLSTGEMAGTCPKCGKSMRACMVELRPAPQKKSS